MHKLNHRFGMNSGIVGPAFECYHGNESHILDCRLVNYTCAPHETVEVQCSKRKQYNTIVNITLIVFS